MTCCMSVVVVVPPPSGPRAEPPFHHLKQGRVWTDKELDEAAQRGDFPRRPSDLFLKVRKHR